MKTQNQPPPGCPVAAELEATKVPCCVRTFGCDEEQSRGKRVVRKQKCEGSSLFLMCSEIVKRAPMLFVADVDGNADDGGEVDGRKMVEQKGWVRPNIGRGCESAGQARPNLG
jgi:hypothetical protein